MKQETQTLPSQVTSEGSTKATESSSTTAQTSVTSSTTGVKQRESQESEVQKVTEKSLQADATQGSSEVSGETQQSSQTSISSQTESSTQSNDGAIAGNEKVTEEGNQNKTIATQTSCNEQSERQEQQRDTRCGRSSLPITKRGQFFNDSYFEDTWKYYQDAVRDVLAKWDDNSAAATDDMTCYRRLRSRDMRDENQAITSAEDSSSYKVSRPKLIK